MEQIFSIERFELNYPQHKGILKLKGGKSNMVNLSEFTKANLSYLKPREVKENPSAVFVITNEPTLVESEFKGQKSVRVHVEGEWNKEKRSIDLSKSNARIVEKTLGSETSKWIGHQLMFEVYRMKISDGSLTDAISVKEVK